MNEPSVPKKSNLAFILILVGAGVAFLLLLGCGIGGTILFFSIQKARDASKRVQCSNNLRQIGVALHNYHDVENGFPTESGSNPSVYENIATFIADTGVSSPTPGTPVKQYLCPTRRTIQLATGKRDYGYAASNGTGSGGASVLDSPDPVPLVAISNRNGASQTLLLTHLWMDPMNYTGGDPTDLGWNTKNNSRAICNTAKPDTDSTGSTRHIGGPHPGVLPCLFADGHVQNIPYDFAHWHQAWAYDNKQPFILP